MAITVNCPACRTSFDFADNQAGSRFDCPQCNTSLTVPNAPTVPAPTRRPVPPPLPIPMSLPSMDLDEPVLLPPPPPPPRRAAPPPIPTRRKPEPEPEPDEEPAFRSEGGPLRSKTLVFVAAGVGAVLLLVIGLVFTVRAFRTKTDDSATTPPAQPLTGEQVYQRAIRSVTLIEWRTGTGVARGSGFVVDAEKKLVMTNYHVVGTQRNVTVYFPLHDAKGQLITDAGEFAKQADKVSVKGEVIARDVSCDLALIRMERLPEKASALTLASQPAPTGAAVYSVGGSGVEDNLLWRLTKGTVRGRAKREAEADFGKMDCTILESDAPVNPGDSGGPVLNDRGELVGVVSHFQTKLRAVSGNIDVEEVRKFMAKHAPSDPAAKAAPAGVAPPPPAPPPPAPKSDNKGKIEGTKWISLAGTINGSAIPADVVRFEFGIDGRLTYKILDLSGFGTYTLGIGDAVTFHLDKEVGGNKTQEQRVVITGDRLKMIDPDGTTINFRKLK